MLMPRVIPCLLLQGKGLVKTVRFQQPRYIGDPINAVRIFNTKEVDELVFLDITATREGRKFPVERISVIAGECSMPFAVGGGFSSIEDIREVLNAGTEKVVINTHGIENPSFIKEAAEYFGNQSIVVSIDARSRGNGSWEVFTHGGTMATGKDPVSLASEMESMGAGEVFLNSIDRDGTMEGYDIDLIKSVSGCLSIPLVACGGAGKVADLAVAIKTGQASAVAAGSLFVFHGRRHAVLISYPERDELEMAFK